MQVAHVSDGDHQLKGIVVGVNNLAQRQAVGQLRSVLVPVPPEMLRHRLETLHSHHAINAMHLHTDKGQDRK